MKKIKLFILLFIYFTTSNITFSQPSFLFTDIAGSFGYYPLSDLGNFRQYTITAAGTSTSEWAFLKNNNFGQCAAPGCAVWRPYNAGSTLINYNTIIAPNASANYGALYNGNTGCCDGGSAAFMQPVTVGRSYTFNILENVSADNIFSVLETPYVPVNLSGSVTATTGGSISISSLPTLNVGENLYCRYSTDGFVTSQLLPVTIAGTNGSVVIPAMASGTTVSYYFYTSPLSIASISSNVSTHGQLAHDLFTLRVLTNSGVNYSFTFSGPVIVVSSGGTTTTATAYSNLGAAFAPINGGIIHNGIINVYINGNTTETTSAQLNAGTYTSVTVQPAGGTWVVDGNITNNATITLNGADNFTLNGINAGGVGLTVQNAATGSASAVRFIEDATQNALLNCTLKGSCTNNLAGVVIFASTTTAGTTGNDNNLISGCKITAYGAAATPTVGIYAGATSPTAGYVNNNLTFSNNEIFDYFNANIDAAAIKIDNGNSDITISGNHIYQTVARTYPATGSIRMQGIWLNNSNINNVTISGNFIGGSTINCGGSALSISNSAVFLGIRITCGTTTGASIQGNTIRNISIASNSISNLQCGISAVSGKIKIGNVTANTIGSLTTPNSITISCTATSTGAVLSGIICGTGTADSIFIQNNTIGGLKVLSTSTQTITINGITVSGTGIYNIRNNTIGGVGVANGITNEWAGTTSGISFVTNTATLTHRIENNLIRSILSKGGNAFGITASSMNNLETKIKNNTLLHIESQATSATAAGVSLIVSVAGSDSVVNNFIDTVMVSSTTPTISNVYGVLASYTSLANSRTVAIHANTIRNLSSKKTVVGIHAPSLGISSIRATQNIINQLNSFNTTSTDLATGIYVQHTTGASSPISVLDNTISGIFQQLTNNTSISLAGINVTHLSNNSAHNAIISGNTVFDLSTNAAGQASVVGIRLSTTVSSGTPIYTLSHNFVHSLHSTSASTNTQLAGMYYAPFVGSPQVNIHNNLIRLGIDPAGADITTGYAIVGFFDTGGAANYYYNSVYIGGTNVTPGSPSSCLSSAFPGSKNVINNIFYNARSHNTTSTAKHYVMGFSTNAGLVSNYNICYAPGIDGIMSNIAGVNYNTLCEWRSITGFDMNSIWDNPGYIDATSAAGAINLHLTPTNPVEGKGTPIAGIGVDYDNQTRNASTPDIGADEGNFTLNSAVVALTLGTIPNACTGASVFSIPYTAATGLPLQYSITDIAPTPMPGFTDVINTTLTTSPLSVSIPTLVSSGTYTFLFTLTNPYNCLTTTYPFSLTIDAAPALAPIGSDKCAFGSSLTLQASPQGSGSLTWFNNPTHTGIPSGTGNTLNIASTGTYYVFETNAQCYGPSTAITGTVRSGISTDIPSTVGDYWATDAVTVAGWTHYCDCPNNLLLLSLDLGGQNIGNTLVNNSVAQGNAGNEYAVRVRLNPGNSIHIPASVPYVNTILNPNGWWILPRAWDVFPHTQPSTPVTVRSYYFANDFNNLNNDIVLAGGVGIPTETDMSVYKLTGFEAGVKLNDQHAGLTAGDILIYANKPTFVPWTLGVLSGAATLTHYFEHPSPTFSGGGGGGGTNGNQPLPLELLSFTGKNVGTHNQLTWVTANESGAASFDIEKSSENLSFFPIGVVAAQGYTQQPTTYQFDDNQPFSGKNFYRLKMWDMDGSNTYSPTIMLYHSPIFQYQMYPNPASDALHIEIKQALSEVKFTLMDYTGKEILHTTWEGTNDIAETLSLEKLSTGIYTYKIVHEGKVYGGKIVIE